MIIAELIIYFNHQYYTVDINLALPVNIILARIGNQLAIDMNQWLVQIYDDRFRIYLDLTDVYAEILRKLVLQKVKHSLTARILHRQQPTSVIKRKETGKTNDRAFMILESQPISCSFQSHKNIGYKGILS